MAKLSISMQGIEEAANSLGYRPGSVKHKAVWAIKSYYTSEESIGSLSSIDTDELIKQIWDLDDSETSKIRAKRRNFFSVRSSIQKDLKKLAEQGGNSENITITDANIFDMTEEAKNSLLSSFSSALTSREMDIDQVTDILSALNEFIDKWELEQGDDAPEDLLSQLKQLINKAANDFFSDTEGAGSPDQTEAVDDQEEVEEDAEEIELDEDEELEEVDDTETEEESDTEEVEEVDEDTEVEEADEDEELEEVDEIDEDTEEIELDEDEDLEEVDDTETEEESDTEDVEEVDEDTEVEEADEDEELEEVDEIDEDTEEIELDEDEDLDEVDELDEDELKAVEEHRRLKELADNFDDFLAEMEKGYNAYVIVPEGTYTIGTRKDLKSNLELQQFEMPEVYMARYPVTNSLFEIFVEQTGYVTTAEKFGYGTVFESRFQRNAGSSVWKKSAGSQEVKGAFWYQPEGPESSLHQRRHHPVVQVSVEDAVAFSSWIGRRIPTEAEWESAARTDMGYRYPWGNKWLDDACNTEQSGFGGTTEVDHYDSYANEFRICDLLGNTMEWTSDMQEMGLGNGAVRNFCVAKGGAWNSTKDITISSRALFRPGFTSNTIGFRCLSELFL
ncbi:MAG: formylglycine-generating enzyme family protein [Desulfarculaceae bacterium]|nr:formylglycine-generating enzyme family protein [Desulfarculaceae bacterium]